MTTTAAPTERARVRWASRSGVLLVMACGSWLLAAIYFFNGLTAPTAEAKVEVSRGADGVELAAGWLAESETSAVFHFFGVYGLADRLGTRLSELALLGTIGLFLFAASRLAKAYATQGAGGVARQRLAWSLLGSAALSAAFVVPFADWAQAAHVLDIAGHPAGLEPVFVVGWGWAVLALMIAITRGLLLQLAASTPPATSAAGTG